MPIEPGLGKQLAEVRFVMGRQAWEAVMEVGDGIDVVELECRAALFDRA